MFFAVIDIVVIVAGAAVSGIVVVDVTAIFIAIDIISAVADAFWFFAETAAVGGFVSFVAAVVFTVAANDLVILLVAVFCCYCSSSSSVFLSQDIDIE